MKIRRKELVIGIIGGIMIGLVTSVWIDPPSLFSLLSREYVENPQSFKKHIKDEDICFEENVTRIPGGNQLLHVQKFHLCMEKLGHTIDLPLSWKKPVGPK